MMHAFKNMNLVRTSMITIWLVLSATIIDALANQRWTILFMSALTITLMLIPSAVEQWYEIKLPTAFAFPTVLFIFATLFLGEVGNFYERFWWWDVVMHGVSAIGFGLVGFTILYMLYRANKLDASPWLIGVFTFAFALAIGAVWEIFEFAMDQLAGFNMQKSGLMDTMWDLIIDSGGALIIAIAGFLHMKFQKPSIFTRPAEEFVDENITEIVT